MAGSAGMIKLTVARAPLDGLDDMFPRARDGNHERAALGDPEIEIALPHGPWFSQTLVLKEWQDVSCRDARGRGSCDNPAPKIPH